MKLEVIHIGGNWYVTEERVSRYERLKNPKAEFTIFQPKCFESKTSAYECLEKEMTNG